MQFLAKHYLLVAGCAALAVFLSFLDKFLEPYAGKITQAADRRRLHRPLLLLLGIFYVIWVLFRPSYYADYHGGSLGDCYWYLRQAINNPTYIYPHHFFFAYVPIQLLNFATWLGFFDRSDPFFFEKAYAFCSVPNRIMAGLGLIAAYALLRKRFESRWICALGTWLLATTFGYWFWTRQCNATGFLLPLMVCTLYALQDAVDRREARFFVTAATLTCLCLYTHISAFHFVLGTAVAMTFLAWRHVVSRRHLGWFYVTCAAWGVLFYVLTARIFGFYAPSAIMTEMSHPELFGHFQLNRRFFEHLLKDPISVPLSLTLGLLQVHDRQSLFECAATVAELAGVLWVLLSLRKMAWGEILRDRRNSFIAFSAISFLFCAVGFAMRTTWLQYYTPVTPLVVFLFVGLAFQPRKDGYVHVNLFPLLGLILGMFFINGFSQTSVLINGDPKDINVYRTFTTIREAVPEEPVVYYGYEGQDWYNFDCVNGYYRLAPKFAHIVWKKPRPIQEVLRGTYDKRFIVLSAADYPDLTAVKAAGYQPKVHKATLPDTPDLYLVGKPTSGKYR